MKDLLDRLKRYDVVKGLKAAGTFAATGAYPKDDETSDPNAILKQRLLMNQLQTSSPEYKAQQQQTVYNNAVNLMKQREEMKPKEELYGYEDPNQIPEMLAGLPKKDVKMVKGRWVPSYGEKTPLFGGFDINQAADQFNENGVMGVDDAPEEEDDSEIFNLISQAAQAGATDEELEQYYASLIGGNQ